jgi:hypothetical protein
VLNEIYRATGKNCSEREVKKRFSNFNKTKLCSSSLNPDHPVKHFSSFEKYPKCVNFQIGSKVTTIRSKILRSW